MMHPFQNAEVVACMTDDLKMATLLEGEDEAHGEEDENTTREREDSHMGDLLKILHALRLSMALFGIYNYARKRRYDVDYRNRLLPSKAMIYNLFVLAWCWSYLVKCVIAVFIVEMEPEYTVLKVIPTAWSFQVAINNLILLKLSHPRFGNALDGSYIWQHKVLPLVAELKLNVPHLTMKRHVHSVIIVGWSCLAINVVTILVFLLYPKTRMSPIMTQLMISPLPINICTKIIAGITSIYISAVNILSFVYIIVCCIIVKFGFQICIKAVEQANESVTDPNMYPGSLRSQRLLHLYTCHAVEKFDKDFKYFFANIYFTTIPMTCFYLYQMIRTEMDSISMSINVFWLVFGLMSMTIISGYAATLNKAAHAPLQCLYQTGMDGVTLDQIGQVNLFVSKLTASQIGFSILDFFVITRELILTVGGIFLTYSIVLLQF